MPIYREIPADHVPATTRRAAQEALAAGCRRLGMALPPEMRWCRLVVDPADVARITAVMPKGQWAPPGYKVALQPFDGLNDSHHWTLWLRTGMSSKETAITALHELRHLWHRQRGHPIGDIGSTARAAEETDCEAWAQTVNRRFMTE